MTSPSSRSVAVPTDPPDSPAIVHLIPHTHWDREWYLPFQTFRMRLVELVDQLLDSMEADPRLAFTLDGQVATIDDYLDIRSDGRARIERLIAEGRLAIGPWQILMDEFLVSGETIVRNLELGWHAAEAFGKAMPIGYLPDMFGHIAQMPQILRRAGIDHAVVWRGVPAAIDRHAFEWRSPDGSEVRTEYLVGGYGNGAYLLEVPDRLADKLTRYTAASKPFYGDRSILAMYGTDHAVPSPLLAQIVADANAARTDIAVRIETLPAYLGASDASVASTDPALIPTWTGELRSAARANMLMNVTSARMDIKAAAARAERMLERYAEPLAALHGAVWPERLLDLAWRRVIDNSAHDSICGCSLDPVGAQVLTRFAEAEQIGRGLLAAAIRPLAAAAPRGSVVIVNPSPHDRTDAIELNVEVPAAWAVVDLELPDGSRVPTQLVERPDPVLRVVELPGDEVIAFFGRRLHGRELFGDHLDDFTLDSVGTGPRTLALRMNDSRAPAGFDVDAFLDVVKAAVAAYPDLPWTLTLIAGDRRRVRAAVPAPALGAVTVRPAEGGSGDRTGALVAVGERSLSSGLLDVRVAADGTLDINGGGVHLTGVGRLVDGGDYGDTYNYGAPHGDRFVEQPVSVKVAAAAAGPIVGSLLVNSRYEWPVGLGPNGVTRTEETTPVDVTTAVELRAGEPFVRITVAFTNSVTDHRVRWHVPLPAPTDRSCAEGQFAIVDRGLTLEAGHGEVPTPTFPAHGFVHAEGATILLDHVTEYELVGGRELALTVLRSTGLISRNDNPFREDPAGPEIAVPGAQMLGPWRFGFALLPHAGSWDEAGVLAAAEAYHLPFVTSPGLGRRDSADNGLADPGLPAEFGGLRIDGTGVVLSALRRRGEWLEIRLVAETAAPTVAAISGRSFVEAHDVDLLGRTGDALTVEADGTLRLSLGPWEIRTLGIRLAAPE